jgi:hypothetical protein
VYVAGAAAPIRRALLAHGVRGSRVRFKGSVGRRSRRRGRGRLR